MNTSIKPPLNFLSTIFRSGMVYSFAILFNRIVPEQIFRMRYFYVFRLDDDVGPELPGKNLRVEPLWCGDETDLIAAIRISESSALKEKTLEQGVRGCLAKIDGKPVAAFWSASQSFLERDLGLQIKLARNQCWLYGARVEKEFRGRQVFPQLLKFVSTSLNESGIDQQLLSVNPFNKPSMAVFSKRSHVVARTIVVRVFAFAVCFSSGNCEFERRFTFQCDKKALVVRYRI